MIHVRGGRALVGGLKILFTLALFWALLHNIEFSIFSSMLKEQAPSGVLMALVFVGLQLALGGMRWQRILYYLAPANMPVVSVKRAQAIYYISVFFNCCLPGTVGGDVVRVWLTKSSHMPLPLSISSVVLDRIISVAALCVIMLATLPWLASIAAFNVWPVWFLFALALVLAVASVFYVDRILSPYEHIAPVRWVLYIVRSFALAFQHKKMSVESLVYGITAHLFYCAAGYELAQSLGVSLAFWQCVVLMPPVLLASMLPITIGGWGVREAGMVMMFGMVGVDKASALLISVQSALLYMIISIPAGVLWLLYRHQKKGTHE